MKKNWMSLLLSILLVVGLVPQFGMTAHANAGDPGIVEGHNVLGASVNTTRMTVYYAGTAWRGIAYNNTGNKILRESNKMTLLASGNLTTCQFNSNGTDGNIYYNSILHNTINDYYNSTEHFSAKEKAAVIPRTLKSSNSAYSSTPPYSDLVQKTEVTDAYLWPLSPMETVYTGVWGDNYTTSTNSLRANTTNWWLRSPGNREDCVSFVATFGGCYFDGLLVDNTAGVRPAFNLNLSSILLTSAAVGGKSSGTAGADSLKSVVSNDSDEWKLTILDSDGHSEFSAERVGEGSVFAGKNIKIKYSGGQTGDNEYVSVFLKKSDEDKILYYGHLAQQSASAEEAPLTIPSDITPGTYTVGVFAEQCNGDKKTDYGSVISTFNITVAPHTHNFTYSADGPTITATCSAEGCPLPPSTEGGNDHVAKLSLVAPTLTTYGGTGDATATLDGVNAFNTATGKTIATTDIKYVGRGSTTYEESSTAPTNAGTYTAKITVEEKTASLNYEIAKADITPVVNIDNWTYGQIAKTPSVTPESKPGSGAVTYRYYTDEACTTETTTAQGATASGGVPSYSGDYWVKATVAETDNYKSGTGKAGFIIEKAPVTVSGITASDKTYDGTTDAAINTGNASFGGKLEGDTLTVSTTGSFASKGVGTNKTVNLGTLTLGGESAGNYALAAEGQQDSTNANITAKEVGLTWTDTELTYNGKAQKPKATAIGLVGDDECEVIVGGEQTDSNIKTVTDCYIATATGLDNGNYKLPDEVTCEFTIAPKDLTQAMISLDSDVIESDGTEQGPEVTLTDEDIKDDDDNPKQLIEDDDYSLSGDVKTSKLGTHVVAVEGKGNYTGTLETSWVLVKEKSNADTEKGVDGAGDINIFVSVEGNTETITVDNFTMAFAKSLLTEEDLARRDAGEDITLYVEAIEESSSDAPLLDRTELQALFKLKSAKGIRWFDIKVWKKIGNDAAISIHELKSELMMSINVPDEHKNAPEGYSRTFYFGTAHNGSARIIEETADTVIVFGSKEFSTYALAYKDTKIPEPDPDKSDNPDDSDTGDNGNGSSSSKGGAKTGDPNDIAGLLALMLASGGALGAIGYRRRRETDK